MLFIILHVPRLVKGDGEIIEEIVSRDRQKAINKVRHDTWSSTFYDFIIICAHGIGKMYY